MKLILAEPSVRRARPFRTALMTVALYALAAGLALAGRPMIIHPSQVLGPPAGSGYYFFGYEVAIDGDWAIVTAATPSPSSGNPQQTHDALLYHRVNGQWMLDRTLVRRVATEPGQIVQFWSVAMNNGVAAIGSDPTRLFRRNGDAWTEIVHPFTAPPDDPDFVGGTLRWDGNTLLAAQDTCYYYEQRSWGALVSTLNPDGSWTPLQRLSSGDTYCDQQPITWALSGDTAVVGTWTNDYEIAPDQMRIFRRSGTTWSTTLVLEGGDGEGDVRGDEIFFSSVGADGTLVLRNDDSQTVLDKIRTVSAAYRGSGRSFGFTHTDDIFLQDRDLFRKNATGKYEHVAMLVPNGGVFAMVDQARISGRRLISQAWRNRSSSNQYALMFDLPETYTPSAVIATGFESGPSPFNPQLGTFAIATTASGNRVYRQSSLAGDYRALLGSPDWVEQSIEADILPTAFSGSNRWAGLAVRYLDDANYYYVTLRSSGVVELKRMRNGVYSTVVQKALPIVAGRNYHVALRAFGTFIEVFIDGRLFLYWEDWDEQETIPHGNVALLGYRAAVDYDNVVAAEVGQRPLYDLFYGWCYGALDNPSDWTVADGDWSCNSDNTTGANILRQASTGGDARAAIGTPTDDMIVRTRARATAFAAASGSQQRWFGIAARYRDPANYYYLSVRNSNTVSLRKLVNGAITVLGTAPLAVTPGTFYELRLDAVGNELRAFVNGAQVLQAIDGSHTSGQVGTVTYRASAEYQDFMAWQP